MCTLGTADLGYYEDNWKSGYGMITDYRFVPVTGTQLRGKYWYSGQGDDTRYRSYPGNDSAQLL